MIKIYPHISIYQALAKQLNLNTKGNFIEKDFNIAFNTFISSDQNEQNNIVRTIIHEIIHGLGFSSYSGILDLLNDGKYIHDLGEETLNYDNKTFKNEIKLFPRPIISYNHDIDQILQFKTCKEYSSIDIKNILMGFAPFSIFEKYIVDINTKEKIFKDIGNLYKEFDCINKYNVTIYDDDYINMKVKCYEEMSPETKQIVSELPMKYYMK